MMRFVVKSKSTGLFVKNGGGGWTNSLQEACIYGNYALDRGYWKLDLQPVFITIVEGYPKELTGEQT